MVLLRSFLILVVTASLWTGCKDAPKVEQKKDEVAKPSLTARAGVQGSYVTEFYELRAEGYDWVAVSVQKISEDEITLKIRSRADIKKPTCTFDTRAFKQSDSIYTATVQGKQVIISFTNDSVTIKTEKLEDESVLYFYCSGGASAAGSYHKIYDPLDTSQIDKTTFSKNFRLQEVGFLISAKPKNGTQQDLVIYPYGLELPNQVITQTIDGIVIDAEIEDLDRDGFPEVLIYTQSGPQKKGKVIACSVLKKKSMILMHFPATSDEPRINQGYAGHDSFALIETNLVQRFPIYENGQPSGKIRQISYQLENGEATKVFVLKTITEFDLE